MPSDLREQLQATLGGTYTVERELGGGGMSRVFLAMETALRRRVVIKVLAPELALGVSVDRFQREIQLAAALQHPHIVPVHSAGDTDGLPWYTMPYVDGESLRARLARGPMTIGETVGILRDVAKALAFAHAHGVVHRDIKPDNVLLAGGSATVADFGIAKAISAARAPGEGGPSGTLTQLGTALGTPTYMAPEQAAGDPSTDHRADLYAFGVMAYEMLAGRAPFTGLTPQRLLAAHMSETPPSVASLRADVPPGLADLVMRCLEKEAERRPQDAGEVVRDLETVTSASGQMASPIVLLERHVSLPKALAFWAAAFAGAAILARAAIVGIGLPDWVFPGTLLVMALGLPAILVTHWVHRATRRALTATPTLTPGGTRVAQGTLATMALKASPHVSWRRTTMGGVVALGTLVVVTGGWMTLRGLGIGPAGSLMAAGSMGERERVLVAEFASPPSDSLLGPTITEAFRTDLAQSANLSIMSDNAVRDVLRRMQRPTDTRVDFALGREIATREGMKAVVDGGVTALGGRYKLTARLVAAQTGEELALVTEQADDESDLIPAIGRLSRSLRERLGESLKAVQNTPRLDQVTTSSLAALQKYVAAQRATQLEGDFEKGIRFMEEAIALDTNFAMAYRRLAVEYNNRGLNRERARAYLQRAYDLRDRLSDAERYLTIGSYFGSAGPSPDYARSLAAYEALIDLQPDNPIALNNLANIYRFQRQFGKAEDMAVRAIAVQPTVATFYNNLARSQQAQGKLEEAARTIDEMARLLPRNPQVAIQRAGLMESSFQFDSMEALMDSLVRARASDPATLRAAYGYLRGVSMAKGRLAEARQRSDAHFEAAAALGDASTPLDRAIEDALLVAFYRDDARKAAADVERALAAHPLDAIDGPDRPYYSLAWLYMLADQPERLRALMASHADSRRTTPTLFDAPERAAFEAMLAMLERRYDAAIVAWRKADWGPCTVCNLPDLARAYDLAENADSAIAVFERYLSLPSESARLGEADRFFLAGTHKRLGELHDAKGNRARAASHYASFVDLWKDADPELQPQVAKVRERLRELQRAERP